MMFSNFPPSNTVKLKNVGPTLSNFKPLPSNQSAATTVVNNFLDLTTMVHFRFIPTPSLDFQVSLNLDEAAPLMTHLQCLPSLNIIIKQILEDCWVNLTQLTPFVEISIPFSRGTCAVHHSNTLSQFMLWKGDLLVSAASMKLLIIE